jgi:hypothetical protein
VNKKRGRFSLASFFIDQTGQRSTLDDALCRADSYASCRIGITDTFGACCCIDNINVVTGSDGGDRAFRFASTAVGAFFGDIQCHMEDVL